jgi:diaminopimelate decarboxylase
MTPKIAAFLQREKPPTPFLVLDVDVVVDHYTRMRRLMPEVAIYYAVKANPAAPVLRRLAEEGACFDDASMPEIDAVLATAATAERISFGNNRPRLMAEPGRALVADAGVFRSEVVLVSTRDPETPERWVYLDIGRFGGLAEAEGEAIQYEIHTARDGDLDLAVVAGPTCDSHDVLYEKQRYHLPVGLNEGNLVDIHAAGAYTTTYSSVGFNGIPPLAEYYV